MNLIKYDMKNLKGDVMGGIVAGVVALPLALAFGVQSGLGATAGLYGAIALGILAAAFGGTATQASGPTGPMTVVSASFVAIAVAEYGNIESAMAMIVATFMLTGILQIIFGFLRVGGYIKYFPYPVISGFMTGVGLIIILLQIFPFAGVVGPKSTVGVVTQFGDLLAGFNPWALAIGGITVIIYYVFPKITKAIPGTLVALITATLIAYFFKFDVKLIGDIPSGLPSIKLDGILSIDAAVYPDILKYAIILAALGSIDSLLTSVIADNITKTKHNSNRELIGQGIGNTIAGLFGGIPGAGATKGTVVNINSGGSTRLSGTIHGLFLLVVLLGAGRFAAFIPIPVLAGLLIPVGFNIIDWKAFKHLRLVPREDAVVLIIVLLITTFGNLIYAVATGVILSSVIFMKRTADIAKKGSELFSFASTDNKELWSDELAVYDEFKDRIFVKRLYGSLFFGFTADFQRMIAELDDNIKALVLRMDRVPYIDQSGLYALEEALFQLQKTGVHIILVGLQDQPKSKINSLQIIPNLVPETQVFDNIEDGFIWIKQQLVKEKAQA